jgi:16S rRNA (cytidine1402-2'-O)-methyltransferase
MPGTLYVVATPIGNLADLSPRAIDVLRSADTIACEDTRTSQVLLSRHGIATGTQPLHAHNERTATARLLEALHAGKRIAVVSDAGTPGVSDPGARLVEAAHQAGVPVIAVPGPNAAVAAWSAAGFATEKFLYLGFLPATSAARRKVLESLDPDCPLVLYEAPHRVKETLADLLATFGGKREVVLARELTKKFEETARMPLDAADGWLAADRHREQGEYVIVLGPGDAKAGRQDAEGERVLGILLQSLPASEAARLAARITGASKNDLYRKAIQAGKAIHAGEPAPGAK